MLIHRPIRTKEKQLIDTRKARKKLFGCALQPYVPSFVVLHKLLDRMIVVKLK